MLIKTGDNAFIWRGAPSQTEWSLAENGVLTEDGPGRATKAPLPIGYNCAQIDN